MRLHNLALSIMLGAAVTVGLVVALGFQATPAQARPVAPAPAAPTIDHSDAISHALAYLRTQQQAEGGFGGVFGEFAAIRAVFAVAAAGRPINTMTSISNNTPLDYLATRAFTYTRNVTGTFPGRLGALIAAVVAGDGDPTAFGTYPPAHSSAGLPINLVDELRVIYNPATGAYSTTVGPATAIDQSWAILGLAAVQETVAISATDFLIELQESDGGWGWGSGFGDVDTTAFVLQALLASANVEPTHSKVQEGLDFLRNAQAMSGGWESWGSLSADSTAVAIQAIVAAGYTPATASWAAASGRTPHDDLLGLQQTDGSFSGYDAVLATANAIPGLAETPVPIFGRIQRANRALTWMDEAQNADGSWSFFGSPDPGATCDAVLAYAAAGFDPHTVRASAGAPSAMDYLSATASSFVTKTADSAGKLALTVEAAGRDAHDFGGVNVIHVLTNTWYSPTLGVFGDANNSWHQAFAILGLAGAGEAVPVSATQGLKGMQNPDDGSWVDAWGFSKPDSTGLVLQALIAAGAPVTDTSVVRGVSFLQSQQNGEGSWDFFGSPSANTTAYVIQGLVAAGEDLVAAKWLKSGHSPYDGLVALQKADGPFIVAGVDNGFATWQAVPALLGVHYPIPSAALVPFSGVYRGPDPDRMVAAPPRARWGSSVDVVIPFGSDVDGDGSVALDWRAHGQTSWITGTEVHRADGYYTATIPGTAVLVYEFQATFADIDDGVQHEGTISTTVVLRSEPLEPYTVYLPLVARNP